MASLPFPKLYLEEVKLEAELDIKKAWVRAVLQRIIWRMSKGINSGSLDPKLIQIIDNRPVLPEEAVIEGIHPPYLLAIKSFVTDFHASDYPKMSPRDRLQYDDFVSFLDTLTTLRQLILLSNHPHLQNEVESCAFLPGARSVLYDTLQNPNHAFPSRRHFPKLSGSHHQVGQAVATDPTLMRWEKAYSRLVKQTRTKRVNIRKSVSELDPEFLQLFEDGYGYTEPKRYLDHDPVHELFYFCNAIKHLGKYYPKEKITTEITTANLLLTVSPTMLIEMFRFFWCYDGIAGIDLCNVIGRRIEEGGPGRIFPGDYQSVPATVFQVGGIYCWYPREELSDEEDVQRGLRDLNVYFPSQMFGYT